MVLTVLPGALLALSFLTSGPGPTTVDDSVATARRVAAIVQLAAQEYAVGVKDGKVVAAAEVEEAKLFLTEARRTALLLPPKLSGSAAASIDSLLDLVTATARPDTVKGRSARFSSWLAVGVGASLEETPERVPALARGAAVYQENCASCHGALGRGDGPQAAGLDPRATDLTDYAALSGTSPLDFYRRITLGVAGTAMPANETRLSVDDRWAAAVYASLMRLPAPRGEVPPALRAFSATARMSDVEVLSAMAPGWNPNDSASRSLVAQVRSYQTSAPAGTPTAPVFAKVRAQLDSALVLASTGRSASASGTAFDAYMTFEQVEPALRARSASTTADLEAAFASFRTRIAGGATTAELHALRFRLAADLENAERLIGDRLSPANLFIQSFVILLREGLEAILVVGALMAFLLKTGAGERRRDLHVGVGAAIAASLLTAVLLETIFQVTPAHREALEGITMVAATGMLFYVSYWLLSKMEVAKWNRFVKGKLQNAVSSGSALALASVAFLAVYREGFETVLFYKALLVSGSGESAGPVLLGILVGGVALGIVYFAINRYGVRIPLKPFFAVTSGFLYYMAFVFAGKGVAELQEGGLVSTTYVASAPRWPALGVYPTVESLAAQGVLVLLLVVALVWTFWIEPRRLRVTLTLAPEPPASPQPKPQLPVQGPTRPEGVDLEMLRSLERMDADLAELRAEVERLKRRLLSPKPPSGSRR